VFTSMRSWLQAEVPLLSPDFNEFAHCDDIVNSNICRCMISF